MLEFRKGDVWMHTRTGVRYVIKDSKASVRMPDNSWTDNCLTYTPEDLKSDGTVYVRTYENFKKNFTLVN